MTAPVRLDPLAGSQPEPPKKEDHSLRNGILAMLGAFAASKVIKHNPGVLPVMVGVGRGVTEGRRLRMEDEQHATEQAAEREQREYQRQAHEQGNIMNRLRLLSMGAVPDAERETSPVDVPTFMTPGMGSAARINTVDPTRYQTLGGGYSLDRQNTPEAKAEKLNAARIIAVRAAAKRAKLDLSAEESAAIAADDVSFRQFMGDTRKPDSFEAYKRRRDYARQTAAPRGDNGEQAAERQRVNAWRSHVAQRARELMKPQVDPTNPWGPPSPGLPFDRAKAQAAQEADDIYGPIAQGGVAPGDPAARQGLAVQQRAEPTGGPPQSEAQQFQLAAARLRSGQATLEDAMRSTALTPAVKEKLRREFSAGAR